MPTVVYRSGRILRMGLPMLACLVAATTTAGIQAAVTASGPWVPVVAAAGGLGVASPLLIWQAVTRRKLEVFDGWFRYSSPGRTLIARWDDVTEVLSPSMTNRRFLGRHEYVVVLGGGTEIRLGSEIGADSYLGDEIEARTRDVIAQRTVAHLSSGRRVDFGPISISQDGIEVRLLRTHTIPFEQLAGHELKGRHYRLQPVGGRPQAVRVSRIPSAGALRDVIDLRLRKTRQARRPGVPTSV